VAFEIGDKVIYPNHGLGVIERIETKTIMGTTCGLLPASDGWGNDRFRTSGQR
jgi:RNA polymerase-interacting CarD/CdnL/TRCF family regulator